MPDRHSDVWEVMTRWRAERRRFVLATVVETRGFTPRKGGAHMLIAGQEIRGTIGGGAIEQAVIEEARGLLGRGGTALFRRHLTRELGMCCGGEMAVFLEVIEAPLPLVVFGAGYIAKPLAAIAAGCGFEVTVVDERDEWATQERFPSAALHVGSAEDFARAWDTDGSEFAVVVTHDHAVDQRLVQHLLARPLRFLGMIGSLPKQRKFAQRLKARGFSEADVARVHTPLGIDIGAATPEEIAVSVVAELVAVRRGRTLDTGWSRRPPVREAAPSRPAAERA